MNRQIDKLIGLGVLWEKHGKRRVYFKLNELFSDRSDVLPAELYDAKLWFDLDAKSFGQRGLTDQTFTKLRLEIQKIVRGK